MGVSGLLGLLKSIQKPCTLKDFHGKIIGVDAYGSLHRGAVVAAIELAQGKITTKHVDFAMHRVRMLIHFGITPYIVFDGDHLPSKKKTEESRGLRRRDGKAAGLELLRLGKTAQAFQELQKAVDVTPEMARQLIDELKRNDIQYVVAPYEADSQLAYLERKGKIDAILSEDSDLLVFGAKCLLTKLDQYGSCIMIKRDDFTACRDINLNGWTDNDFRCMAILSGCDYLDGVHKMGLKTAHRLIRKYKTIQRVIQGAQMEGKFRIPPGYLESFTQADMTFRYQYVYCPDVQHLVHLTPPESETQLEGITYIGDYVEPEMARRVASGAVNPMTKQVIISIPAPSQFRRTPLGARSNNIMKATPNDSAKCKKIDTFFKPRRTPLAELDPNSFTPSPSQQRLLRENASREWASEPVTRVSSNPSSDTAQNAPISVFRMPNINTIRPLKRQRLCDEPISSPALTPSQQSEQSPFFASSFSKSTSSAPQPSTNATRVEESLWSDDSLDNALVTLAEPPSSMPIPKKSKFTVFVDEQLTEEASKADKFVESSLPLNSASDDDSQQPSIFSKYLLEETEDFTRKYSSSSSKSATPSRTASRATNGQPIQGQRPPPAEILTEHLSADTKHAVELPPEPLSPTLPPNKLHAPSFLHKHQRHQYSTTIKGSEDMLLIPESDAASIADSDFDPRDCEGQGEDFHVVPASSPPAGRDDGEDMLEGGSATRFPKLDLSRFAFGT